MNTPVTKLTATNVEDVVDRIQFDAPQVDATYGNVNIRLYMKSATGEKHGVSIETPWMKAPFGLSTFEVAGSTVPKFKLPLSFDKEDSCPRQQVFKRFCELLDEKVVKAAHENAGPWLKKDGQPEAVIKAFYTPLLAYAKDERGKRSDKYPAKIQIKLGTYSNDDGSYRFAAPVYKDKNTQVGPPTESIAKGMQAKTIVEFTGIWEVSGKFGAGWRANVVKIKERVVKSAYQFQDDSDDDDDDATAAADDCGESKTVAAEPATQLLDDDVDVDVDDDDVDVDVDDEEEAVVAAPEPEPESVVEKKKPARRGGRKKKDTA